MIVSSVGALKERENPAPQHRKSPPDTGTAIKLKTLPRASGFIDEGTTLKGIAAVPV
jgi:hypothetical protein